MSGVMVGETQPKYQNFAVMRVLAATAVIFSHSYLIADDNEKAEPFVRLIGEGNILGIYGVFVFFFISGFLVTRSALSGKGVLSFAVKRALRIYPALLVYAFLAAGVLGSIFTSLEPSEFWKRLIPFIYTIKTVILPFKGWMVPTVSFPPFGSHSLHQGMNGSLWTISPELCSYFIIAVLLWLGWLRPAVIAWIAAILASVGIVTSVNRLVILPIELADFIFIVPYFFAGALVYFIHARWGLSGMLALIVSLIVLLIGFAGYFMLGFLLAAYPVLWFCTTGKIRLPTLESVGDISYGLYLWGWPMLQVGRVMLGGHPTPIGLFLLAWPMTAVLGYLSWHLLEKHALALVPAVTAKLTDMGKMFRRGRAADVP